MIIACIWVGWASPAGAVLVIDSQGDPNFQGQVLACFEQIQATGGPTAEILEQLNRPSPQAKTHTIQPTAGPTGTNPNGDGGTRQPSGDPGPGVGSTIDWDPDFRGPFPDQVAADPCASLLHELAHALDYDKGRDDSRRHAPQPQPGWQLEEAEVNACREENRYRAAQTPPLPQRGAWRTPGDLPPDAKF